VDKKAASGIRVKQDGQNGEKRVVYVATRCNGITDKREVKQETILKAAVLKRLLSGHKVTMVASRGGSGNLDWPATDYYPVLSSGGIPDDIGARNGSTIRAADSGYVSSASYQGAMAVLCNRSQQWPGYSLCALFKHECQRRTERSQGAGDWHRRLQRAQHWAPSAF
jgi:hypothetical protein